MRRTYNCSILRTEDGQFIGINLNADFTAEHEHGIAGLKEMFSISDQGLGIERRVCRKAPPENRVVFKETKTETILMVGVDPSYLNLKRCEITRHSDRPELIAAWDEQSFGLNAATDEDRMAVRLVYEAMLSGNLAMWLGGGGIFQNAGLVVALLDAVPEGSAKLMYDADLGRQKLQEAADKTGIVKKLEKADLGYYALSPKWVGGLFPQGESPLTKHDVVFWLNPHNQDRVNYGWFTVEQLEQWIDGEGPIPKKRA